MAAFENRDRGLAGVQYHPEVMHTPHGQQVFSRFLHDFAGLGAEWTPANIADELIEQVRTQIGDGYAICGLSGGVDSAVAAALVQRAIGDRLTCVFVDHGLLRDGEPNRSSAISCRHRRQSGHRRRGGNLPQALSGVTNPEGKRKAIGREFIRAFEGAVRDVSGDRRNVEFLVQGTLYPDVVESGGGSGTANIKSHHNVGGLPETCSSNSSSRCGCCSRTRCARLGGARPAGGNRCAPAVSGARTGHPDRR